MPLSLVVAGPAHLYAVASFWYVLLALRGGGRGRLVYLQHEGHAARRLLADGHCCWRRRPRPAASSSSRRWSASRPPAAAWRRLAVPVMLRARGPAPGAAAWPCAAASPRQDRLQLEQRVREATAEIEHNFRQLAELRVEQVTERERKRIAADLHDDLGAKLLTIVHTSDSERISTLAREALEEMRLSVRGLTGKPVRLVDALGDWRAEVVSRLAQAGIEADWSAARRPAADAVAHAPTCRPRASCARPSATSSSTAAPSHCSVSCDDRRRRLPARRAGQRRRHRRSSSTAGSTAATAWPA